MLSRPIPSRAANRAQRNPVLSPSRRQSPPPGLAPYLCRIVTSRSARAHVVMFDLYALPATIGAPALTVAISPRTLDEAAGRFRPAQNPGSKTPSARSPPSQGRRTPRLKFRILVSNACPMDRRKGGPTREPGIPVPVRRCRCVRSPILVRRGRPWQMRQTRIALTSSSSVSSPSSTVDDGMLTVARFGMLMP